MIKRKIIIYLLLFFTAIMSVNIMFFYSANAENGKFYSDYSAEIVMDSKTNRVLYSHNADIKKFMASTTKILTAIVVIENCDLDEKITVTDKTVGVEGSSIYLEKGEILSVRDLLYGLMLRSGNDCAETLAVHVGRSISAFADLMNEKAKKIGAANSHFVNPHGLHDDDHYTTAYDLALISSYAIKNPEFKKIVSTKSIDIPFTTRDYNRHLVNKNKMLTEFEGSTGIKTGYTKKAGRCLVSSCERNGMELVCVVLNCPPMWETSKALLTNAFNSYSYKKVVESDYIVDFAEVEDSDIKCGIYVKNDVVLPLTEKERESLEIKYNLPEKLVSPLKKDDIVGNIEFYVKNNLIYTENLYTMIDI